METKKFLFLIDNGHGGVIDGVPQTAGKRSPDFGQGIVYEGVSNRCLASKIKQQLDALGIDCMLIVPEVTDVPLAERIKRVNTIAKRQSSYLFQFIRTPLLTKRPTDGAATPVRAKRCQIGLLQSCTNTPKMRG